MIGWLLKKIIGSKNQREVKRLLPHVPKINAIEQEYQALSADALREKVAGWKARLSAIEDEEELGIETLALLPEAFAAVKNAARRLCGQTFVVCDQPQTWDMVHFDVQLIGGMVLHGGKIAEMSTGEGKTLVATLGTFLNALSGRGVHVITVNDYLARRDAEWMGNIYRLLGLTVGCIQNEQMSMVRREQYACDITYGTASEFGFDYLRDNGMATTLEQQVQRGHHFAVVDEVDSILIDEARTPLIISGPATVSTQQYDQFKPAVENLVRQQTLLCTRLVNEARELAEKLGENPRDVPEDIGRTLFKVKLGQPRNKQLLRMMEVPAIRRSLEKAELSFYQDSRREALFELKEELFFTIDERTREADLSEKGREYLSPGEPESFVLPDLASGLADIDADKSLPVAEKEQRKEILQQRTDAQAQRIHSISQLLRAYCLYEKDVHYVVEDNKVMIVDESTGRKMPGRRWSDGLHQAVEAKEGVKVDKESQTLATVTIQNYFRLYHKLAGMTGTAETEANEFKDIYGLDVIAIPTNRAVRRVDMNDRIFKTRREKYNAVVEEIRAATAKGQPVLVGTASVESSETLSRMLKREKIPHAVLNAKFHRQEAEIVSRAGQRGSVTISTNMAGRGTDIKLGPGVVDLGGLYVLGTERHEARRIDRQLRGRCARQGDPGLSRFFVSFEDDLMRNFGAADRMTSLMERFGMKDGEDLEHPLLNRSVETAQKRVEQRNYVSRKHTLDYDDVMNRQRQVLYEYRTEILTTHEPRKLIVEVMEEILPLKVAEFLAVDGDEEPNPDGLLNWLNVTFPVRLTAEEAKFGTRTVEENGKFVVARVRTSYERKVGLEESEAAVHLERAIMLNAVDRLWQEHLYGMDGLREGIDWVRIGQKDPLVEYKKAAYIMFEEMMESVKTEILHNLFRSTTNLEAFEKFLASLVENAEPDDDGGHESKVSMKKRPAPAPAAPGKVTLTGGLPSGNLTDFGELPIRQEFARVGRNDACPCGSGKKYKSCCGRTA